MDEPRPSIVVAEFGISAQNSRGYAQVTVLLTVMLTKLPPGALAWPSRDLRAPLPIFPTQMHFQLVLEYQQFESSIGTRYWFVFVEKALPG
jgi:hypothetical protein